MPSNHPAAPEGAAPQQNPAEIARETFRRLATQRLAPTPEAYRAVYEEIAGVSETAQACETVQARDSGAEQALHQLATKLCAMPGNSAEVGRRCLRAAQERDWDTVAHDLAQLCEAHPQARAGIELAAPVDTDTVKTLRDSLSRALTFGVASLLGGNPDLATESEALGAAIKQAHTVDDLEEFSRRLKQLFYQIEIKSGDTAEQQELLLRLFNLLLENVSELLDDDSWVRGQVEAVQSLIAGPLDQRALEHATRSLKEVIFKQSQLKHNLSEVKLTLKNMMMTFIDRLGHVAARTGDFHEKIGAYSGQISRTDNIVQLNQILEDVLRETHQVQSDALQARDMMVLARQEVEDAETRIHSLEVKLQQMSELVREDQLTGSLNRRGMDEVFERETARSDRRGTPLCIAMLDLDNFKRLNDAYGHQAGDDALKHLVKVVKQTLRAIDVIARFGGEEFLILLPETTIEAAVSTMTRMQRELTRHFFLHDNEKVLITFSAGVALRGPNEDQAALVKRADRAMYLAKQSGKNRVEVADDAAALDP